MSPSIYQIMDFVFFHCSSFSFGAFLFTTLSCLVIKWNSGYSSIFSVILNNTIGMLMMSSIIFQHAVKFLLELSVGACRVTVCVSLSLSTVGCFLEEFLHQLVFFLVEFLWITKFRPSLFFLNVLHIWCFWCGALTGILRHFPKCSCCTNDIWNLPSAKSTLYWLPCFEYGWIYGHRSLRSCLVTVEFHPLL